jgi:peptidoglycan hydrolase-like protein with peptidoglycan-binding domain
MHKNIKFIAIAGFVALALVTVSVAPRATYAETSTASSTSVLGDLQSKIKDLLAQVQALQQQIRGLHASSTPGQGENDQNDNNHDASTTPGVNGLHLGWCLQLNHELKKGDDDSTSGGEVSKLQRMLAQHPDIFPSGKVTGFFGSLTEKAIERLQAQGGVVATGTPSTTGFGRIGKATRALFAHCDNLPPGLGNRVGSTTASTTIKWHDDHWPPRRDNGSTTTGTSSDNYLVF